MASNTDPLKLNEVGKYGELAARPNPLGLVILNVPPFEAMLPHIAQTLGRALTAQEIEAERLKAPSIVVTREIADHMTGARGG